MVFTLIKYLKISLPEAIESKFTKLLFQPSKEVARVSRQFSNADLFILLVSINYCFPGRISWNFIGKKTKNGF